MKAETEKVSKVFSQTDIGQMTGTLNRNLAYDPIRRAKAQVVMIKTEGPNHSWDPAYTTKMLQNAPLPPMFNHVSIRPEMSKIFST